MVEKRTASKHLIFAFLVVFLSFGACSSSNRGNSETTARILYEAGLSYFQEGNYPDSIANLKESLRVDPQRSESRMLLGMAYMKLEHYDSAEAEIEKACSERGDYPECWNNLSTVLLKRKKYPAAIAAAQRALSNLTYSTPEFALGNIAQAYIELGQFDQARSQLEKAKRLSPDSCSIRILSAKFNIRAKNFEEALKESQKGLELCTLSPVARVWEAYAHYKIGERPVALRHFEENTRIFKNGDALEYSQLAVELLKKRQALSEPTF